MNIRDAMLEALRALRAAVPRLAEGKDNESPLYYGSGICDNVSEYIDYYELWDSEGPDAYEILAGLFTKWPGYGSIWGSRPRYPVGGSAEFSGEDEDGFLTLDQDPGYLWRNPRRIELLNWLIEEFERETNN